VIEIRPARSTDVDGMCTAHIEAWRVAYRGVFPDAYLDSPEFESARREGWARQQWRDDPTSTMFAAALDGNVVGFGHVGPERSEITASTGDGELYSFYLHPLAWGTGVAQALLERCHDQLIAGGFERAVLWALRDNPRARRFYEKSGWHFTGVETMWDGPTMPGLPPCEPVADVKYGRDLA